MKKLKTKSITEEELVGKNNMSSIILCTKMFIEDQGYKVEQNTFYQDNKFTILMQENGKKSSSKRTRHLNIRCVSSRTNYKK